MKGAVVLLSLYPTDSDAVRAAVLAQAEAVGTPTLFTSLHIPESDDLRAFGGWLQRLHRDHGLAFWADVSPATLERLGLGVDDAGLLACWGVKGLRIDYGLEPDAVRRLAQAGPFRIAVNASTIDAAELDALADLSPVGWHNFYPRPETGLDASFYRAQSALFVERGLEVVSFVPGEMTFRAPLRLGLPTVESHRGLPSYVAAVELARLCPQTRVCCAEGTVLPEHVRWWRHFERTGEVTLPLVGLDAAAEFLLDAAWSLRAEQTGVSQRLEGTRGRARPVRVRNATTRASGSLQMDLERYGRYAGEVHLMTADRPLDPGQARIADVAAPYASLVRDLRGRDRVRFVRWTP